MVLLCLLRSSRYRPARRRLQNIAIKIKTHTIMINGRQRKAFGRGSC